MNEYAIDNYLLDLIRGEVDRAAKADADFAPAKARRDYGLCLIRTLPNDLDWSALEVSLNDGRRVHATALGFRPKAIIRRLEKLWRKEQSQLFIQANSNAKGFGR